MSTLFRPGKVTGSATSLFANVVLPVVKERYPTFAPVNTHDYDKSQWKANYVFEVTSASVNGFK